ncbi:hypothetical protein PIB30_054971 [Stylosanthes scabra]|uniref:Uncharacterized protein n=1 Tax=Stylosanthes scabra TaxID=79078 RepID=A0ABU6TJK2_9FABA|nr:hypothetical protein [Stylosanthes scabra]
MPTAPRATDVDADEDYLQYFEGLRCHPEYSHVHSSQAFAQNPSDDARYVPSDARSQPSFELSGIWLPPVDLVDYLQFIEELERHSENSPIRSGHASVSNLPEYSSDRCVVSHGASSYDLSGVWPPLSSDLSL